LKAAAAACSNAKGNSDVFESGMLRGKRILVTGGGTGLGASMGRRFLELGADLVICGRRAEVLNATAAQFQSETGGKVMAVPCDVRDAAAVEKMMDRIWEAGPLDALVNNAAGNFIAETHKLSPRAIDAVLNTVLHGSAYCTVAAGRRWIEASRRDCCVLSILTLSALKGAAFRVPSAMAKAGVLAMIRSLAVEWGPKGIRTVAIAPGPFPTAGASQRLTPAGGDSVVAREIPLGRNGEHAELANLAAFLLSDMAAYINGECIAIDGGKQFMSDAGSRTYELLGWTADDWERMRQQATAKR
jgi:NAD(P)-dependent dehydrogenase (short-subunit alcohol dehydrogenase family)